MPPFTAITGALGGGERHQPWPSQRLEIARLLLDAGADPNDGQGLYNNGIAGQDHDDPSYLRLLVKYGLGASQDGPWYQRFGTRLRDPGELLYDELETAAYRNRPAVLSYLVQLGLDLDRRVGRSRLTAAQIASAQGHEEILAILAAANEVAIDADTTFPEITVRYAGASRRLQDPELIGSLLRQIHRETKVPVLVKLQATSTHLGIGLGRKDLSVALYLDSDGTSWFAVGSPLSTDSQSISFAGQKAGQRFEFYEHTAIAVESAFEAARDFVLQPLPLPQSSSWHQDGAAPPGRDLY